MYQSVSGTHMRLVGIWRRRSSYSQYKRQNAIVKWKKRQTEYVICHICCTFFSPFWLQLLAGRLASWPPFDSTCSLHGHGNNDLWRRLNGETTWHIHTQHVRPTVTRTNTQTSGALFSIPLCLWLIATEYLRARVGHVDQTILCPTIFFSFFLYKFQMNTNSGLSPVSAYLFQDLSSMFLFNYIQILKKGSFKILTTRQS